MPQGPDFLEQGKVFLEGNCSADIVLVAKLLQSLGKYCNQIHQDEWNRFLYGKL